VEIGNLTGGMYPCVRSSCTGDLRLCFGNFCECILDGCLNRYCVRLNLPTVIVCAIVFDCELDISHRNLELSNTFRTLCFPLDSFLLEC